MRAKFERERAGEDCETQLQYTKERIKTIEGVLPHPNPHSWKDYCLPDSEEEASEIIDDLINCRFDGLAGCEPECLDLISLKKTFGSKITFMTGIQADLLYADRLTLTQKHSFIKTIDALGENGGFVLCSATGVSSAKALERLKDLYQWADEA